MERRFKIMCLCACKRVSAGRSHLKAIMKREGILGRKGGEGNGMHVTKKKEHNLELRKKQRRAGSTGGESLRQTIKAHAHANAM